MMNPESRIQNSEFRILDSGFPIYVRLSFIIHTLLLWIWPEHETLKSAILLVLPKEGIGLSNLFGGIIQL
jgi:hypothetical protein